MLLFSPGPPFGAGHLPVEDDAEAQKDSAKKNFLSGIL
jgi:hypothetical protein